MKIKVREVKLGVNKLWGRASFDEDTIELDPRLCGKKHLEISIHESLHLLFPTYSEEDITAKAISITNLLWKMGYRRIDNTNNIPLQNGKKC